MLKDLGGLMKKAQEMQTKMQEMQDELETREIEGQAGGGIVKVILDGKGNMKKVNLDPVVMSPDDHEILEDLIVAAHNDAKIRVEKMMQDEMAKVTGGMQLPPGFKMPF